MIPIFITSYGRHQMLARCIHSLRRFNFGPITVIDNQGDAPLLPGVKYIRADNTFRQVAPWGLGLTPKGVYVVTDGDCAITDDCPDDLLEKMREVLDRFPDVQKVGAGINTANFPDPPPVHYRTSFELERLMDSYPMRSPEVRDAPVDTTFAMYRDKDWPGICGVRLESPYLIEHLPWLNEDYTEEEHRYYQAEGMATWARTHSAASEVAPKVIVPFTSLRSETVVALADSDIPYEMMARPITDDEGYFFCLAEAWTPPTGAVEPFILVEHDIVVRPETLRELRDCPEDWCAAPFEYLDKPEAWGMGCVKFSDRLIARNLNLFHEISEIEDAHPARHWCVMDYRIWTYLTSRGEHRHDHPGPALEHIGHPGTTSAHGCVTVP